MIIVTGGAGFIGSNLIRGLNEKGINDIIVVDNLENSKKHRNLNSLEFIPFPEELIGKYQYFTQAELSNLRKAGYSKEFTNIKDGIEKYIRILKESHGYYK